MCMVHADSQNVLVALVPFVLPVIDVVSLGRRPIFFSAGLAAAVSMRIA